MRRLAVLAVALFSLAACNGGKSATAPAPTGSVVFKLDANTCGTAPGVFTFFIDGAAVGSIAIAGGQSSPSYTVVAGTHFLSARLANTGYTWQTLTADVPAGKTWTYFMTCS